MDIERQTENVDPDRETRDDPERVVNAKRKVNIVLEVQDIRQVLRGPIFHTKPQEEPTDG